MIRKAIPSLATSLGLLAGCFSITCSLSGNLYMAGIMILAASLFDFADGMLAHWLDSISEFGKQLDSLADVVSFGVAPAMLMKYMIESAMTGDVVLSSLIVRTADIKDLLVIHLPFAIPVFSALRLARFNLDEGQVNSFKGLATPANAICIAGLGFMAESEKHILPESWLGSPWFWIIFVAVSCFLLVSDIRMFSLKFRTYGLRENFIRYLFLAVSVVLLLITGLPALLFLIILYILLSLVNNWITQLT